MSIIGNKYGRLTVVALNPWTGNGKNPKRYFDCLCECGGEKRVQYNNLLSGRVRSCGCLGREVRYKHGHYVNSRATPTRQSYEDMIRRCSDSTRKDHRWYVDRGIRVCDRWLGDGGFLNFLSDMGEKPAKMTLDRINPDGNYEPSNCRWADATTQSRNTGLFRNNKTGVRGVSRNRAGKYLAGIRVDGKTKHLGTFATIEEAAKARKQAELEYWK